jgi:16S rRNA (guanine527-N7)-methyltransferase
MGAETRRAARRTRGTMNVQAEGGRQLNELLNEAGLGPLEPAVTAQFAAYLELLIQWNRRINLSAVREPDEILRRHFIESIFGASALPPEIQTLLDYGSGAGLPGIPIAICRPEIRTTLAESQGKKAAFLAEVVRRLGLAAEVHRGRAEALSRSFDCVTLRAVDQMEQALEIASRLVRLGGWVAIFTTRSKHAAAQTAAGEDFIWSAPEPLPFSGERIFVLGRKRE